MHTLFILDGLGISIFSIVFVLVMVHSPLIKVAGSLLSKLYGCYIQLRSEAKTLNFFVFVFFLKSLSMLFVFCCIAVHDVCSLLYVCTKCASVKISAPCAYLRLMSWSYLSRDAALAFCLMLAVYVIFPTL